MPDSPVTPERPRCTWCDRKVPRENHRPNCPRPDERYTAFDLAQARSAARAESPEVGAAGLDNLTLGEDGKFHCGGCDAHDQ